MVNIAPAASAGDLADVRTLFSEYAELVAEALCLQNFGEELAALPGEYAPPGGVLLLDTLPKLTTAIALYRSLGFREIGPYLACPTPGAICFELKLS